MMNAGSSALPSSRSVVEIGFGVSIAAGLGLALGVLSGLPAKYQVAALVGGLLVGLLVCMPERRLMAVMLWIVVQPLSIEKVFYMNSIDERFVPQAIVVNAADGLLVLLGVFLVVEALFSREKVLHWPRFATWFSALLLWSVFSALVHAFYLESGHTSSTPLALLTELRLLLFILIMHSAVRSRAEIIAVLYAIGVIVVGEAVLVGMSYATGQIYNFTKLSGGDPQHELQTFSSEEGKMVRGVGTLGHTNQQAAFHTFYTIPLTALLVVRNGWIRVAALVVIGASAVAVALSFSRSAWMSFAISLFIVFLFAWWRREIKPIAWVTGGLVAVVAMLTLAVLAEPLYERLANGDDGATESRMRMIDLAVDLFETRPVIGVGPGEYPEAALLEYPPEFTENEFVLVGKKPMVPPVGRLEVVRMVQPGQETLASPLPVHNKYLLTLSELGVVGLVIWIGMYVHLFREAWTCAHARDTVMRYFGVAGFAMLAGSACYMLLDLFSDDKSMQILLFIPILITAAARIVREQPDLAVGGAR